MLWSPFEPIMQNAVVQSVSLTAAQSAHSLEKVETKTNQGK